MCLASCNNGNGDKPGPGQGGGNDLDNPCGIINDNYPWRTTNLIFQLTDNSNSQELPSTCRRYLAGDLEGFEDDASTIDDWVSDRNKEALEYTNVTISYEYLPDTASYGWGQNITLISEEVQAKEEGRHEMYCNFV
jgi:hypothetical protein